MSHTASRVIQACAKHGSDAHRQALFKEAAPRVVDLAKSSYGHFLLSKLITAAPKSQIAGMFEEVLHEHGSDADDAVKYCVILLTAGLPVKGGHPSNLRHSTMTPATFTTLPYTCLHGILHVCVFVDYEPGVKPA